MKAELELKKKYKCEICDKKVASHSSLVRHIKIVHNKVKKEPNADPDYGQPMALNANSSNLLDDLVVKQEFISNLSGGNGSQSSDHQLQQQQHPLDLDKQTSNSEQNAGNNHSQQQDTGYPSSLY